MRATSFGKAVTRPILKAKAAPIELNFIVSVKSRVS